MNSIRSGLLFCGITFLPISLAGAESPCVPDGITVPAIHGRVYFESNQDRKPLTNIKVTVSSSDEEHPLAKMRTSKGGRFEFHDLKRGQYYVSIDGKKKKFAGILVGVQLAPQEAVDSSTPELRIILRNNYFQSCSGSYVEVGDPEGDKNLALSMYTDFSGMVSPSGKALYVAITKNGLMTFADEVDRRLVYKKRMLSDSEQARLQAELNDGHLSQLKGKLSPKKYSLVDYHVAVSVMIPREYTRQEFTLSDYSHYVGEDYPPVAKNLLCLVDELRGSSYRLTQECK
jgi:hypothetical protein